MKDREKELRYLIYLKGEIIKQAKKDIKNYNKELKELELQKKKRGRNI